MAAPRARMPGLLLLAAALLAPLSCLAATASTPGEELRLWPGPAPGTQEWKHPETVTHSPNGDRIVSNVVEPTLTVFLPPAERATGAAVVVVPGGALRILSLDNEGTKVARWLNERGIAAFVLKHRTLQIPPGEPLMPRLPAGTAARGEIEIRNANANPQPDDAGLAEVLRMSVADAQAAMRLVRSRAAEWRVDPHRVGMMGFSAGGGVAVGVTLAREPGTVPDFLVSLYGPSLQDVHLADDAPPLFIAVGSEHFNVTRGCLALFAAWRAADRPAELHVYDGITGGFGMTKRGVPVDGWNDRLHDWLVARGIVGRQPGGQPPRS